MRGQAAVVIAVGNFVAAAALGLPLGPNGAVNPLRSGNSRQRLRVAEHATESLTLTATSPISSWGAGRLKMWSMASPIEEENVLLHFRLVSVTLYCVMVLTFESLVIHTVLALARNSDELAGKTRQSLLTKTLSAASHSAVYPSMLSMLFVGCRMYVLATTDGLGEPPAWVKGCMIIATVGMTFQFLVMLLLPFGTDDAEHCIEQIGGRFDVHPNMHGPCFKNDQLKISFWFLQIMTMALIYIGALGVLIGIATFPSETTQIPYAVICTCILSALYFVVFAMVWAAHTYEDLVGAEESRFRRVALCMGATVQTSPMVAVVFLVARMRALQLDPPLGIPPRWAQFCFIAVTAAAYLETIMSAYIGATGQEVTQKSADAHALKVLKGIYGIHVYSASRVAHTIKHAFSAMIYLGLVAIAVAVLQMKAKDGNPAPLSPTVNAVYWYAVLYFGINCAQWLTFFARDVLNQKWEMTQSTVLAAGVSTTFVPLLCILFVACRMRALQITHQQGSPPGWTQDCMLFSIFATCSQVLCCLLMPLFTNHPPEVDGDGNAEYDLRPMIGAYAVAIIKYVALLGIHGGTAAVCVAIFTMTPETAKREVHSVDLKHIFVSIGVGMLVVCISMLLSSAKVVGLAIKLGIESVPDSVIGARIKVGKAALSICEGYVNIEGFHIENPTRRLLHEDYEPHWRGDNQHFITVGKLIVKINMWRLAKSFGKEFELTAIVLHGVHVIVEKPSTKELSNVGIMKEFLESSQGAHSDQQAPKETTVETHEHATVFVEHVDIKDIRGKVISPFFSADFPLIGKVKVTVTEKQGGGMQPTEVVTMILKSIVSQITEPALAKSKDLVRRLCEISHCCGPWAGSSPQALTAEKSTRHMEKDLPAAFPRGQRTKE